MDNPTREFLYTWFNKFSSDAEFAEECLRYINLYNKSNELAKTEEKPQALTLAQTVRIVFMAQAEGLCNIVNAYMGKKYCDRLMAAMIQVFDSENGIQWFKPRKPQERFNTACFCRMVYNLYTNGFFREASVNGNLFKTENLRNCIVEQFAIAEAAASADNPSQKEPTYRESTINTYMHDSAIKDFEKFCAEILPNNF